MIPYQLNMNPKLKDLNPLFAGEGTLSPNGIGRLSDTRNAVVIHYVSDGKGVLWCDDAAFPFQRGQIFLISPGDNARFTSDAATPCTCRWVGFTGELSNQFTSLPPVISLEKPPFPSLDNLHHAPANFPFQVAGDLMYLYSTLLDPSQRSFDWTQIITEYVQRSYMGKCSVEALAKEYNVARQYLTRYFKKRTGKTIQEYIMEIRLFEAKQCLLNGRSVKEACALCGFRDTSNFHKVFKRYNDGLTPKEWLRSHERRLLERKKEQRS